MEYAYHTKTIWCGHDGKRIFGIAFIPQREGKVPLVIFSHELGYNHETGIPYGQFLASRGYAFYTFDYCGGSIDSVRNRSDGRTVGMSMITEADDLRAVIGAAKKWDFVDPDAVVLLGGSQGALVAALNACARLGEVRGLMLMYPALIAMPDVHKRFGERKAVPHDYGMFGHWIQVGRKYALDIWDLNFYDMFAHYPGNVLLLHGDHDRAVDISYSRRAAKMFPRCEFHVITNGGHIFHGQPQKDAARYILGYLDKLFVHRKEKKSAGADFGAK